MEDTLCSYPGLNAVIRQAMSDGACSASMLRGEFSHLQVDLSTEEHGILLIAYREFALLPVVERTISNLAAKIVEVIKRDGVRERNAACA